MKRGGARPVATGRFDAVTREARRLYNAQRFAEAADLCVEAIQSGGRRDTGLLVTLAMAQMCLMRTAEAKATLEKALAIDPRSLELRWRMVMLLVSAGRHDEAETLARKALRDHPHDPGVTRLLAESLSARGRRDEAIEALDAALRGAPDDLQLNFAMMQEAAKQRDRDRTMEHSGRVLGNTAAPPDMIATAWFTRGTLLDRLGDYDNAFEAFERANATTGKTFDSAAHSKEVDALLAAWTPEALGALPRATRKSDRVVLIVGMPRSGTSLVEQILASHPRAYGAGELHTLNSIAAALQNRMGVGPALVTDLRPLTPRNVDEGAARYLHEALDAAPGADRVTDKMPANFFHLGLVAAMLPQAKVIHCVRDARDTCLSCYFSDFMGWGHAYTSDLASLGAYYGDYWRVMAHWKRVRPVPVLDVQYEELTSDQESQTRRLLDFVGLDFDERCLRFHETRRHVRTLSTEQVKKPMYRSSVARWRHYEQRLGPLLERLPREAMVEAADNTGADRG